MVPNRVTHHNYGENRHSWNLQQIWWIPCNLLFLKLLWERDWKSITKFNFLPQYVTDSHSSFHTDDRLRSEKGIYKIKTLLLVCVI